MNHQLMMKNLKKLIHQYNFLSLELDDIREEHSELSIEFESLFSDIIPKSEITEEQAIEESKKKRKKERVAISDSTKKVYKDVAKELHPDKGGKEDDFRELNERYKKNDLLGVVSLAAERGVEFELSDDDVEHLKESIQQIESQISHYKTTLAYVWKYGNSLQRRNVIGTLSTHLGKKINLDELSEEIKNKLI